MSNVPVDILPSDLFAKIHTSKRSRLHDKDVKVRAFVWKALQTCIESGYFAVLITRKQWEALGCDEDEFRYLVGSYLRGLNDADRTKKAKYEMEMTRGLDLCTLAYCEIKLVGTCETKCSGVD